MYKCTDMTPILGIENSEIDMSQPVSDKSATELMEQEIADDMELHRAYDLFETMCKAKRWVEAKKVAWHMYFKFGLTVDGLFE